MRRLLTRRQALERASKAGATFTVAPALVRWAGAVAGARA
jgi:hypothetical protein